MIAFGLLRGLQILHYAVCTVAEGTVHWQASRLCWQPAVVGYSSFLVASAFQDRLVVSADGVGLYKPDPAGKPQVFFLGKVVQVSSLYIPGPKVCVNTTCIHT